MRHPKFNTTPEVSRRMGRVKLKAGDAESALAKALWHKGVRYRLNYRKLPGSPDIAITKHRVAVFIDGEFWHGYNWPERREGLVSNREYWIEKIEENMARDQRVDTQLIGQGWLVLRFWEKEVKKQPEQCVAQVLAAIAGRQEEA